METTDIVRKLFDGVVPERTSEIESIANDYDAQFRLIADREGFNLDAGGFSAIQYTSRSMWICPYISRHLLSLNPLLARCRRYSRGER